MLVSLKEILALGERAGCAVPAFNVYNIETLQGVMQAAEELHAPVIFQIYSRLFDSDLGSLLAPSVLTAIGQLKTPAAFHLDHGAGEKQVLRALRSGASGVMIDASALPLEENIALTRRVVDLAAASGVPTEGELGHVGTTQDEFMGEFTKPDEAVRFVAETGIAALAILIGTAHGRYKKAPKLDIERIAAIRKALDGLPLVLHGGSGIPDDQVKAAIAAGIRKVNFGTDLCYAFLDGVAAVLRSIVAVDVFMREPVQCVKAYAEEKIRLLGAEGKAYV